MHKLNKISSTDTHNIQVQIYNVCKQLRWTNNNNIGKKNRDFFQIQYVNEYITKY